ncbi:unnamed protein product [Ceutorhynchus assimilis]|uniref:Secreted protein n=1 Tax=Ceutorhynchus assimilis TaxID=467358 RepID=A0A9N9MYJ1_9CUCU|nr:unnamed protein product [Ceutorhynchus assimilis]
MSMRTKVQHKNHIMKLALILLSLSIATVLGTSPIQSPPHPCQCWPEWNPVLEGADYHCKDSRSEKTFHCNIEIPPICTCKQNGSLVKLPLGEVNCVGGGHNDYDNTNCETTPEWEAWFNKNPQYRLYH